MQTSDVGLEVLMTRVAKLERKNRFWKIGSVLAALVLAFSLAVGVRAQQSRTADLERPAKSLEAQSFVLVGPDGSTRGLFTVTNGIPRLELFGPNGKVTWSTDTRPVVEAVK